MEKFLLGDVNRTELVRRLLRRAWATKDVFLRAGEPPRREVKDWRRCQFDLPVATDASDVDRVVYGIGR